MYYVRLLLLIAVLAVANVAWAEPTAPSKKYPKNAAGLQALLHANPDALTFKFADIGTGKPEWVVTPTSNCPTDLKVSANALACYLNTGNADVAKDGTTILLKVGMSQFVFDDAYDQPMRDLQKEARIGRTRQGTQATDLGAINTTVTNTVNTKIKRLSIVTVVWVVLGSILIPVLVFLIYRELMAIKGIKSGKSYDQLEKETLKKVSASQEKQDARVDKKVQEGYGSLRADNGRLLTRVQDLEKVQKDYGSLRADHDGLLKRVQDLENQKIVLPPRWDPEEEQKVDHFMNHLAATTISAPPNTEDVAQTPPPHTETKADEGPPTVIKTRPAELPGPENGSSNGNGNGKSKEEKGEKIPSIN